jgi:ABC-type multidrug transport system fused ATPase/permease subunit
MSLELMLQAIAWATLATAVSQAAGIGLMWWLGVPPKKLVHEIEDVQNPAVGASFFIIAITASLFISLMASSGFSTPESDLTSLLWIIFGLVVASIYVGVVFAIAHRVMGRVAGENVYKYIRRELIAEQNVSLAFFLGALSVPPFIAIALQII